MFLEDEQTKNYIFVNLYTYINFFKYTFLLLLE